MKKKSRIDFNYKVRSTLIFSVLFSVVLFYFSYRSHLKIEDFWITNILCICGCIIGWLIGIISTPYNKNDEGKLIKFSSMIGTFVSGYLLSKVDGLILKILNPETFFTSLTGIRFILFLNFFILSWIVVFVFRIYTIVDEDKPIF